MHYLVTFFIKIVDNILNTSKIIFVQENKPLFASMAIFCSDIIYYSVTKNIVSSDSFLPILVVACSSAVGCFIAVKITDKLSKDRMYVNSILSDDKEAIIELYDFFIENGITAVISDSYTRDWQKTFELTVYSDTKEQSRIIDKKIAESGIKAKRLVTKE